MPKKRIPKYACHKTGQARFRYRGKDYYLGVYGTPESKAKYEELVSSLFGQEELAPSELHCDVLAILYLAHARKYYVKNGEQTSEVHAIRVALRHLVKVHGDTLCQEFGPIALEEVRQSMVAAEIVRKSVNRNISRIRRAFKWAVGKEMVDVEVWQRLRSLEGLAKGRSDAIESDPIAPVPKALIKATLPHVNSQIRGMILTQWATGMRPGEVCSMRGRDISPYNPDSDSEYGFDLELATGTESKEDARKLTCPRE